jgi:hypothetical protein
MLGSDVRAGERTQNVDCTVVFPVPQAKLADKTEGQRIRKDWYEAGCLALVNQDGGFADETQRPLTGPRRISAAINLELVKKWLGHCKSRHRNTCIAVGRGSHLARGLRVIDCHSRATIDAPPTCRYFALSYVWGDPGMTNCQDDSSTAESQLSPVVSDAIDITLSLGERYLWVDQLVRRTINSPCLQIQSADTKLVHWPE